MPPVTSQIPGGGTSSLLFAVPGNGLDVETVYVEVDATAAAGAVTAELTIQDQSGVVIARKPQAKTIAAGGTGSATWGLRLDDEAAAASGGLTCQFAGYSAGVVTINKNTTGNLPVNTLLTGPALLDISTPAFPVVVAAGIYVFTCKFRLVLALSGNPTLGDSWQGKITVDVGYDVADCLLTNPNPAGGYLPAISATTVPITLAAGAGVTFSIRNSDTVKNLVFDSPNIGVSLLS